MVLLTAFLITIVSLGQCAEKQKVLLISLTSFRPDYVETYNLTSFKYLRMSGVHAKLGMKPSFTTDKVPNLYTVATGLYTESHGVLSNIMWDPIFNETFYVSNYNSKWWEGGEPIWVTAKKQGKKTAAYSWPGSEAKIRGVHADVVLQMLRNIPIKDQIDTVVDWFREEDMDLIVTDFDFAFSFVHFFGSHNVRVEEKLKEVDSSIDYLMYRLATEELIDIINVIIVSDHGLTNVTQDEEHIIDLSKYIDPAVELQRFSYSGGSLGLWTKKDREMFVYKKLLHAHPKMKLYTKKDIPDDLHVKNNRRCPPLWAFAEEGYVIKVRSIRQEGNIRGVHGYSNEILDTRAIFYASGPAFKQNYVISELDAVNVYPLICRILDIKAAPNNGSLKVVMELLKDTKEEQSSHKNCCNPTRMKLLLILCLVLTKYLNIK